MFATVTVDHSSPLASPCWKSRASVHVTLDLQQFNFFSVNFTAAQSDSEFVRLPLQTYLYSATAAAVVQCIIWCHFVCDKKFHVVCAPPHQILATPLLPPANPASASVIFPSCAYFCTEVCVVQLSRSTPRTQVWFSRCLSHATLRRSRKLGWTQSQTTSTCRAKRWQVSASLQYCEFLVVGTV